jgi:O-succinylbenzoic acid--CoA ligase
VREVAVTGVPDPEWGARVVAVVVPADPASPPTLESLRAQVSRELGRRAAPAGLVVVDDLPRLALGKIDRTALRRLTSRQED